MAHGRTSGIIAALVGVSVAALITATLYIGIVAASFFVAMPAAARNEAVVATLLTVIFTGTFLISFRKMGIKNNS